MITAYRFNDAQPEWMECIWVAWQDSTMASPATFPEIKRAWRLNQIHLCVSTELLTAEAENRGLIERE